MLELGGQTPPAADLIKDVSEADFMAEVIEASQSVPVIVDFLGALVRPMQDAWSGIGSRCDESWRCCQNGQSQC